MKFVKPFALVLALLTTACNTTTNSVVEKKPLVSDQHLLLSLLNRPMTEDHKIMVAFTNTKLQLPENGGFVPLVSPVMITGPYQSTKNEEASIPNFYSQLIARDSHAIRVQGPN